MKRIFSLALCGLLLTVSGAAQAAEYKEMNIRVATANPQGSLHVAGIERFKEYLEDKSGGKIKVTTFYAGSTGDEQSNVKQLRSQELHATVVSGDNLTPFSPRSYLFVLPYFFPTVESAHKLFSNTAFMEQQAEIIAKESDARPLAWFIGGYRALTNSVKPITAMVDLQGLKMRVPPVEVQLESFRSWGIEPHPLAWTETFQGLQQHLIDGQDNPFSVIRDQKFWEVQKYITEFKYMLMVAPLLVSEKWYSRLDPATQALVKEAALAAQEHEWKWVQVDEEEARQQCLNQGMVLLKLEDENVWKTRARRVWVKFIDRLGGQKVLEEALDIMQR